RDHSVRARAAPALRLYRRPARGRVARRAGRVRDMALRAGPVARASPRTPPGGRAPHPPPQPCSRCRAPARARARRRAALARVRPAAWARRQRRAPGAPRRRGAPRGAQLAYFGAFAAGTVTGILGVSVSLAALG